MLILSLTLAVLHKITPITLENTYWFTINLMCQIYDYCLHICYFNKKIKFRNTKLNQVQIFI